MTDITAAVQSRYISQVVRERNALQQQLRREQKEHSESISIRDAVILALLDELGGSWGVTANDVKDHMGEHIEIAIGENIDGGEFFRLASSWRTAR